uniref:Uncharacterized protein n=1 Tax=Varanus komodoensis TaxID=61221 RepID=A0A8D2JCP9_VARKO
FDPQQLPLRGLESWRLNSPPSYTFSQNSSAFLANMARAQAGSGKVTLFQQKTPGGLTYRIPALLYLPSESTFLAFAEERSTPRDEDAKFLVMRRGQKEGMSVQFLIFCDFILLPLENSSWSPTAKILLWIASLSLTLWP